MIVPPLRLCFYICFICYPILTPDFDLTDSISNDVVLFAIKTTISILNMRRKSNIFPDGVWQFHQPELIHYVIAGADI